MDKKRHKQLIVEIPEDFHTELKMMAALRNITLKKWVYRALKKEYENQAKYLDSDE